MSSKGALRAPVWRRGFIPAGGTKWPRRRQLPKFDVIVVGSGASGGWAAKRLAEAGVSVALVDCGRPHGDEDFTEHKPAWQLKYRDRAETPDAPQDAAGPEGLLRVHGIQRALVRQRSRGAVHRRRTTSHSAGRAGSA